MVKYKINADCTDKTLCKGSILSISAFHLAYSETQQQTRLSYSGVSHQHDFEHVVTSFDNAFSVPTIPHSL